MTIKLKQCPKCGRWPVPFRITFNLFDGNPHIEYQYKCITCGVSGKVCGDMAEAAEEWNRMVADESLER